MAFSVLFAPHVAHAQDCSFAPASAAATGDAMLDAATVIEAAAQEPTLTQRMTAWRGGFASWRNDNRVLFPLYAAQVGLQALDIHSTTRAINAGSSEGNALMSGISGSPAALLVVKAGAAASTIYLTEKLSKRSRTGAVITMVGVNSAYALIVAHNYRSAR